MRIAIFSDIHANGFALDAVLKSIAREGADTCWFLGDIVGYGPHPAMALEFLRELPPDQWVPGNHDAGMFEKLKLINGKALAVLEMNRQLLLENNPELYAWFKKSWPEKDYWVRQHDDGSSTYYLVHGSLWPGVGRHENLTYYTYGWRSQDVFRNLKQLVSMKNGSLGRSFLLTGHTHIPMFCYLDDPTNENGSIIHPGIRWGEPMPLPSRLIFINPGSVGQPRDGDPRASFALLDTDEMTITFHRVEYPIRKTQREMRRLGFPEFLIRRLAEANRPHDWPEGWVV